MQNNERLHDVNNSRPVAEFYEKINVLFADVINYCQKAYDSVANHVVDSFYAATRSYLDALLRTVIPLVKLSISLSVMFFTSLIFYFVLYRLLIPKDMINEPIFFNYNAKLPTARINLLSEEKQWEYYRSGEPFKQTCGTFFKSQAKYDISLQFGVSKSEHNQERRRCMVTVSMIDCAGDVLAQSTRPLIVPYHSKVMSTMDVILFWPKYIIGYGEIESLTLSMMNNFRETNQLNIPTEYIEITLSSHDLDIESSSITILPLPAGIT